MNDTIKNKSDLEMKDTSQTNKIKEDFEMKVSIYNNINTDIIKAINIIKEEKTIKGIIQSLLMNFIYL